MPLPRNPVVRAGAILRKGGAHEKSASGQRQLRKSQLRDEIEDWLEEVNEVRTDRKEKGGDTPPSSALPTNNFPAPTPAYRNTTPTRATHSSLLAYC